MRIDQSKYLGEGARMKRAQAPKSKIENTSKKSIIEKVFTQKNLSAEAVSF